MPIYTVDQVATRFADWKLEGQNLSPDVRETRQRRYAWDAKVHIFNASTVATIVTLALAIFRSSPLMLIFSGLFFAIRQTFMENINWTVQDSTGDLLDRQEIDGIKTHLGIRGPWEPIQHQFLKLRLWMRAAPQVEGSARPPVPQAAPPAPVNEAARAALAHVITMRREALQQDQGLIQPQDDWEDAAATGRAAGQF